MGKHKSAKFKYHYIMRYLNGESPTKLGREINIDAKWPGAIIYNWAEAFDKFGLEGLKSKTGMSKGNGKGRPKKKKRPEYEEMSKEELIDILDIKDYFIDEFKKKSRARFIFNKIYIFTNKNKKYSISFILRTLEVSSSGYYYWLKEKKSTENYRQEWLDAIEKKFNEFRGVYGSERIHAELRLKEGLKLNIKTVKRYMNHLD